ncbi:MAG TPA: hypothetical protein VHL58_06050 [Thermoanaerobaculia bacterium]|nr:hypothetical protein [Thermoanaerobaculia bacterium]
MPVDRTHRSDNVVVRRAIGVAGAKSVGGGGEKHFLVVVGLPSDA